MANHPQNDRQEKILKSYLLTLKTNIFCENIIGTYYQALTYICTLPGFLFDKGLYNPGGRKTSNVAVKDFLIRRMVAGG